MIGVFSTDPAVVAVGEQDLRIVSWSYIAARLVFVISSMFQAMGNTRPSLVTSLVRVVVVAIPALALARVPGFRLTWVWYLTVVSVTLQMALGLGCSTGNTRSASGHRGAAGHEPSTPDVPAGRRRNQGRVDKKRNRAVPFLGTPAAPRRRSPR